MKKSDVKLHLTQTTPFFWHRDSSFLLFSNFFKGSFSQKFKLSFTSQKYFFHLKKEKDEILI